MWYIKHVTNFVFTKIIIILKISIYFSISIKSARIFLSLDIFCAEFHFILHRHTKSARDSQ